MKFLAISLALGDIYNLAGNGTLKIPLDGGIARFRALTKKVVHEDKNNILVVSTAGYSKKYPLVPQPERQSSLADQLHRFVGENEVEWLDCIVVKPLCWSTRNEVRLGIRLAQYVGFASRDNKICLCVASNLTHLPRIWLYTKLYAPKIWKVKFIRATHHFSLRSHLMEPAKFLRDLRYTFRVLSRLWKFQKLKKSPL